MKLYNFTYLQTPQSAFNEGIQVPLVKSPRSVVTGDWYVFLGTQR